MFAFTHETGSDSELIRIEINGRPTAGFRFGLSLLFTLGLGTLLFLASLLLLPFGKGGAWSWRQYLLRSGALFAAVSGS
jgi:hypothetical protein